MKAITQETLKTQRSLRFEDLLNWRIRTIREIRSLAVPIHSRDEPQRATEMHREFMGGFAGEGCSTPRCRLFLWQHNLYR